jgi:hypothetical protein
MRGFRFLEMRGGCGCGCARVYGFPICYLFYFALDHTPSPSRERRSGSRTIAEPAGGRSETEEEAQEREKSDTSGVHGGGYFAPHGTNNIFWRIWIFIYVHSMAGPGNNPVQVYRT